MTVDRMVSVLGALLLAIVSWLSVRTLDKLDSVSNQVTVMSMSMQQVPALSTELHEVSTEVRKLDRRMTFMESHGVTFTPPADNR